MNRLLFLMLSIPFSLAINAQQCDISVTERFDSLPFIDFARRIEEINGIRFYFKPVWIDSIYITNLQVPVRLSDILDEHLKGRLISYYFYDCSKIILTYDYTIQDGIPRSLLNKPDINTTLTNQDIRLKESSFVKKEIRDIRNNKGIIGIGDPSRRYTGRFATITGQIRDTTDNSPVPGALIFFDNFKLPVFTDADGNYIVHVQTGSHTMHFRCVGKTEKIRKVMIYSDGIYNESLDDNTFSLQEVYVYANKEHNVRDVQLGVERIDADIIRHIPSSAGESDIIKLALLLPGVQSVGEGASGFNVRGGSVDQNLILIDNMPVYNSSHLFGFFSTVNSEMVQDFQLYKSSYPAYFGGRLSSVFDVNLIKGNAKKFSVSGGINPITGKLLVEGPVIKNKVSFVFSGRSTYSDWILKRIKTPMMQESNASFYDINAKINADLNKQNSVQLSGYYSYDFFKLNYDTSYTYRNLSAGILWKHTFTERLSVTTNGLFSEYVYNVGSSADSLYAFTLNYKIQHYEGKLDFLYLPADNHKIRLGAQGIKYSLNPGSMKPGTASIITPVKLATEQGVESALYINDEYTVNRRLLLNLGFRYSMFYSLGPAKVYKYSDEAPRGHDSRVDSAFYARNDITGKFAHPEFRFSARYQLTDNSSFKVSFAGMSQYIHMLTNTTAVSPTDIWTLSDPNLKPQYSKQYSLGYYRNFYKNWIETSVELYYKETENILEFKPGAKLLVNPNIEMDLLAGTGKAYGSEFMIRKKSGKLNGWMSYTYSRSLIKVDGRFTEEKINSGKYYPANYDKPHDFTIVSNYKFSRRIAMSAIMKYSTGRPITYPVGWYVIRGRDVLHYSNRNEYRIPDYFRIDVSLNLEGNLKSKKLAHGSWSFSLYNLTGRDNVYSVYFVSDPNSRIKGYKLSVFSRPIPAITYNFKF